MWQRCPLATDARIKRLWNDTVYIFVEDFDLVIDTEQFYTNVKIRSLPCAVFQNKDISNSLIMTVITIL